jgi:hypothetical protein
MCNGRARVSEVVKALEHGKHVRKLNWTVLFESGFDRR